MHVVNRNPDVNRTTCKYPLEGLLTFLPSVIPCCDGLMAYGTGGTRTLSFITVCRIGAFYRIDLKDTILKEML